MNVAEIQRSLPHDLVKAISGFLWQEVFTGCSTSHIFRLKDGLCRLYLKVDLRAPDRSLLQEKLRLEWLQGQLPVPEVKMFAEDDLRDYLLLSEIPGDTACTVVHCKDDVPSTLMQLAAGIKMIHSLPAESCPFDASLRHKIELAQRNIRLGLVGESYFDESRSGRTAADLFSELLETVPDDEDFVFTHGDYCLPNIIIRDRRLSGFVDWGRAGLADRYQDIALVARSVESNFGSEWVKGLFEMCDIEPDHQKIEFYKLLDEFF